MPGLKLTNCAGEVVYQGNNPVVLGRAEDADVKLPPADIYASRRHCLLYGEDGAWFIKDLHSRNGTRLATYRNGEPTRVRVFGKEPLQNGDQLYVGMSYYDVGLE